MFKTLRNRLILSQILPTLIVVPLMGVLLVYVLETQILRPALTREMLGETRILAEVARLQPKIWQDPAAAQKILSQTSQQRPSRVMILDASGALLASTDEVDQNRIGQVLNLPGLDDAQAGESVSYTNYSQGLQGEAIDVLTPVHDDAGEFVGVIRITYRFATIAEDLMQLRYLIGGVLLFGLVGGTLLGYVLAVNLNEPIRRVTNTMYDLARGDFQKQLPEYGPEEIQLQLRAVNYLVGRLHELEQARKQLLANIVHELGRPLGALRVGMQALTRGAKDDPELRDELLSGMDLEMERLQYLLEELAHLHDQVLGTLELNLQPVNLSIWLPQVLIHWREAAKDKKQTWQITIPNDLPPILVDSQRLAQAIGNLVSNAIKYTPVGGSITISAGSNKQETWIQVRDSGFGISAEEQAHIFEPFFRGGEEQRIKQGMGLGLSIAHNLVVAHNGRIEVESAVNQGSEFTIWLPKDPLTEPNT